LTKNERIWAFAKLGEWMRNLDEDTRAFLQNVQYKNPWYTPTNVHKQLEVLGNTLTEERLQAWLAPYAAPATDKIVGLVLAGNIPLVGFHDILSTLIMGFTAQLKVSSDDAGLSTMVLRKLVELAPAFGEKVQWVDRLSNFDLVIATGSNNSARYFEYYFGKKPHIIRKNRNSIAVLTGEETVQQIENLGHDIFDYFGLGCRSVSKIFIPDGYDIAKFYEPLERYKTLNEHFKYNNNYDYNKSIYLINGEKHFDNGFLLLKEDEHTASPLAVVFFEYYDTLAAVEAKLNAQQEAIQCVLSETKLQIQSPQFSFGGSQAPALDDYADGVNTLDFLANNQ